MTDTIINTPPRESDSGGWAVAVIVLLAVIAGGFIWYTRYANTQTQGTTNINVSLPIPGANNPSKQ